MPKCDFNKVALLCFSKKLRAVSELLMFKSKKQNLELNNKKIFLNLVQNLSMHFIKVTLFYTDIF